MRGAGLQGFTILHHGFDRERGYGTGESLVGCFLTLDNRHRHVVLGERGVDIKHLPRLVEGFLLSRVTGVPFLPQELGRPQEHPRSHLPANDVGPLVNQDRQVAIRLHPLCIGRTNNRLAGRADDERFFELASRHETTVGARFQPMMRHNRTFFREPVDVFRLFL